MTYTLKTPNKLYNGITEGVPFSKGIGKTDDKNIRNVLVNDYKYEDITDYGKLGTPEELEKAAEEVGETTSESSIEAAEAVKEIKEGINIEDLTVPQLKELAKDLKLSNYSKMTREELIELIEKNA